MTKKTTRGITLIELIMAMVILAAVAIPMASMIGAQLQGAMDSSKFTAAGNLARREMERLHNIPYASIANGSSAIGAYTVDWTVTTIPGSSGAERKDITLTANRTGTSDLPVTLFASITKDVTAGL
jgi:prepilin-type N-terminal cleavage/methylation domain-containing protein